MTAQALQSVTRGNVHDAWGTLRTVRHLHSNQHRTVPLDLVVAEALLAVANPRAGTPDAYLSDVRSGLLAAGLVVDGINLLIDVCLASCKIRMPRQVQTPLGQEVLRRYNAIFAWGWNHSLEAAAQHNNAAAPKSKSGRPLPLFTATVTKQQCGNYKKFVAKAAHLWTPRQVRPVTRDLDGTVTPLTLHDTPVLPGVSWWQHFAVPLPELWSNDPVRAALAEAQVPANSKS